MSNKPNDLSEEMYHRLYRLIKRKIDPRSIAATLNIPLRTVLNVISRIDNISAVETEPSGSTETDASQAESDFLDIYVYQRTRYVIVRLVGSLVESRSDSLNKELGKILETSFKAVALKITDVRQIDEQGKDCLLQLKKKIQLCREVPGHSGSISGNRIAACALRYRESDSGIWN